MTKRKPDWIPRHEAQHAVVVVALGLAIKSVQIPGPAREEATVDIVDPLSIDELKAKPDGEEKYELAKLYVAIYSAGAINGPSLDPREREIDDTMIEQYATAGVYDPVLDATAVLWYDDKRRFKETRNLNWSKWDAVDELKADALVLAKATIGKNKAAVDEVARLLKIRGILPGNEANRIIQQSLK